jgi:hypothetical protein
MEDNSPPAADNRNPNKAIRIVPRPPARAHDRPRPAVLSAAPRFVK